MKKKSKYGQKAGVLTERLVAHLLTEVVPPGWEDLDAEEII